MPKKSDRKEHESAMSSLLPEVSLDEPQERGGLEEDSSTELQNSGTTESENYSSESVSESETSSEDMEGSSPSESNVLSPLPSERPKLQQKLGPYISNDVDAALEEVYLLMRRRFGGDASKSLIVEAALRLVLSDYLRRGEESEISRWMEELLKARSSSE